MLCVNELAAVMSVGQQGTKSSSLSGDFVFLMVEHCLGFHQHPESKSILVSENGIILILG